MDTNKILHCISQMRPEYRSCIYEAMNYFIQEVMDFESFSEEGPRDITLNHLIAEIEAGLNHDIAVAFRNCALEFCITNEYLIEGEPWNCINHLLERYSDLLTLKDKKHLKALNASYLSLYKVSSAKHDLLVLQDIIEKSERITVTIPAGMGEFLQRGQIIAARLLSVRSKTKATEYSLSDSFLIVPEWAAKETAKEIKMMMTAMSRMMSLPFLPAEMRINDTEHNRLLQKKMWAKEILEAWYLYKANYLDYHELYDHYGNPTD